MNDELYKRLEQYLDTLEEGISQGVNFALEQAPLVVQEFILYHRLWETTCLVVLMAFAVMFFMFLRRQCLVTEGLSAKCEQDARYATLAVIGLAFSFAWMAFAMSIVPAFLKAWFAPRVLLLEEIGRLL